MSEIIGFYDSVFFGEADIKNYNGLIIKVDDKKEFVSHKELEKEKAGMNGITN